MRILLIKTSSLGDIIHTLPALTDAGKKIPGIAFDWVVEESFAELPKLHPLVQKIIPVALRRWRKNIFSANTRTEVQKFCKNLRVEKYDLILDAQGLLKSAILTRLAKGKRAGPDWNSAREAVASLFYQQKLTVNQKQHAIVRMRQLFSLALGYQIESPVPEYGLRKSITAENYLIFLHGTTWASKHWPENYWIELANLASVWKIKLPWGNQAERERAERIAAQCKNVEVLPRLSLTEMMNCLASAKGVVTVDTGLGHLAVALDVPTVSLYGPTDPALTGIQGKSQQSLAAEFACAPCFNRTCTYKLVSTCEPACFATLPPQKVLTVLVSLIK